MADADPTTPRPAGHDPASAPTTPPPEDAALITACTGLCDAQGQLDALLRDHPARTVDEERAQAPLADALHARVAAATQLAVSLPARTLPGLLAKGHAALAAGEKDFEGRNVTDDDPARLMLSAVHDLVGLLGASPQA